MKIKELHIRNIASIEKADIDFETGLNDGITNTPASIFLISGDTGTGKSVLLDAIAMALYKKTPRIVGVINRTNNEFTDDQGETISIHSIEQYTRLGISSKDDCYSEVVFEGNDGQTYHAKLTLGIIQSRKKDESGKYRLKHKSPVWEYKEGTNDWQKVEAKGQSILGAVGLTFEQFGRMAMLAQGQFASFLTGDKKERESILEQLTNTEHFTRYGEAINRIFKRAEENKVVAQNNFNLESEHTLPEEMVTSHRQRLTELESEEKNLSEQISKIESKILQIEKFEENNNTKTKLLEQRERLEAETRSDEYKDKEALVSDWDKTSTERQRIADKKVAEKRLEEAQVEEQRIKKEFCSLISDLKAREIAIATQKDAVEVEKLWLNERAGRDTLYTTFGETKLQIEQIQRHKQRSEEIAKGLVQEKGKSEVLMQKAEALKTEAEKATLEAEKQQSNIDRAIEERKALNPEEVIRRTNAIVKEKNALQILKGRIEALDANLRKVARDKEDIERGTQDLKDLEMRKAQANELFEAARKKSEEAKARLTTMSESLKDTLTTLRKRLIVEKEEHCPLCGQKLERIYAEEEFHNILTPIEKEQQMLAKECNKCELAYSEAKSKYDTTIGILSARSKQFETDIRKIENEKSGINEEIKKQGLPTSNTFDTREILDGVAKLMSNKENEEKTLQEQQQQLHELQSKIETLSAEKKHLDKKKEAANLKHSNAVNELSINRKEVERLSKELEGINAEMEQLSSTLSSKLDHYYPYWQSDLKATLTTLIADARLYIDKKSAVEKKEREIEAAQILADTLRSHYNPLHTEYPECESGSLPKQLDCGDIQSKWIQLIGDVKGLKEKVKTNMESIADCEKVLAAYYAANQKDEAYLVLIDSRRGELDGARKHINTTKEKLRSCSDAIKVAEEHISAVLEALGVANADNMPNKEELLDVKQKANTQKNTVIGDKGAIKQQLEMNDNNIAKRDMAEKELGEATKLYNKWEILHRYFGGTRFRTLVQTYVLRPLLNNANIYLEQITDRYKLTCSEDNEQLSILVHDLYNKGNVRSATLLSGGERFMISLALSLALSSLNRPDMNINILFIDEGFGTLDEKSLESVMTTLEKLQEIAGQSNRRVGIISHREELYERIPVQIQVKRRGEGRSAVEIINN